MAWNGDFTEVGIEVENGKKCVDGIDMGFSRFGNGCHNVNYAPILEYKIV